MPHITLEISDNIKIQKDWKDLFGRLHKKLAETLAVNKFNCKSRVIRHSEYFIYDGQPDQAFAHLIIKTLDRHPEKGKQALGEAAFKILTDFFAGQTPGLNFQPSVEIHEMKKKSYYKWPKKKIFPE